MFTDVCLYKVENKYVCLMHGCVCLCGCYRWIYVCDVKEEVHLFSLWLRERREKERRGMTPWPWRKMSDYTNSAQCKTSRSGLDSVAKLIIDQMMKSGDWHKRRGKVWNVLFCPSWAFPVMDSSRGPRPFEITSACTWPNSGDTWETQKPFKHLQERATKNQMVRVSTSLFHYFPMDKKNTARGKVLKGI